MQGIGKVYIRTVMKCCIEIERLCDLKETKVILNTRKLLKRWCRHQESNPGPTDYKKLVIGIAPEKILSQRPLGRAYWRYGNNGPALSVSLAD